MTEGDTTPVSPETSPRNWRDDVRVPAGLIVLAGIWLIVSPFVLGYGDGDALWNPIAAGALTAALGLARVLLTQGATALSAANAAVGVWLFVSAFWLATSGAAVLNSWLAGVVVFVLAVLSAADRSDV